MKKIVACAIVLLASLGSAFAADPVGEWVVEEGVARIRIVDCDTRLWGVVSWERQPGGLDSENPDATKKTRPTLGMPILLNMRKTPPENRAYQDQWEGKVYNAENGKIYDSKIRLTAPDKLELKGCVLGFLCGGQTWTRYIDPAAPVTDAIAPKPNVGKRRSPGASGLAAGNAAADPTTTEICSLPEIAGTPH